jgi:hypothetical protein
MALEKCEKLILLKAFNHGIFYDLSRKFVAAARYDRPQANEVARYGDPQNQHLAFS